MAFGACLRLGLQNIAGTGYTGPTTCVAPFTCKAISAPYYYQVRKQRMAESSVADSGTRIVPVIVRKWRCHRAGVAEESMIGSKNVTLVSSHGMNCFAIQSYHTAMPGSGAKSVSERC